LVNAPVSDVHIHCAAVQLAPAAGARPAPASLLFLHASPEYAMKRLLAAGSGDIYQICHVVRARESSRLHNPEFTLIEWYRLGFSLEALMEEVEALVRELLGRVGAERASERISYRDVFARELALPNVPRARFERDNAQRRRLGVPVFPPGERLLAALVGGFPDCAGVALGFVRTLMLATGATHIEEVLAFPTARA